MTKVAIRTIKLVPLFCSALSLTSMNLTQDKSWSQCSDCISELYTLYEMNCPSLAGIRSISHLNYGIKERCRGRRTLNIEEEHTWPEMLHIEDALYPGSLILPKRRYSIRIQSKLDERNRLNEHIRCMGSPKKHTFCRALNLWKTC